MTCKSAHGLDPPGKLLLPGGYYIQGLFAMNYKMVALDLDGTLLGPDGQVSVADRNAVADLVKAGVLVVPCTGRSLTEATPAIRTIEHQGVCVLVDGAHIYNWVTRDALSVTRVEHREAKAFVETLADGPDAVIALLERPRAGSDYLVIGRDHLPSEALAHFARLEVSMTDSPDALSGGVLRMGVITTASGVERVTRALALYGEGDLVRHLMVQTFPVGGGTIKTVELLPHGVNKWEALRGFAASLDIGPREIAAIGDSRNDAEMIAGAGCGIAMGNACGAVLDVAKHRTLDNSAHGVAFAVRKLLDDTW